MLCFHCLPLTLTAEVKCLRSYNSPFIIITQIITKSNILYSTLIAFKIQ